MSNPWDVRPRQSKGDPTPDTLFHAVGAALTAWEQLESDLAELFDCLVSGVADRRESNRSAFMAFITVKASSARTDLREAAVPRALAESALLKRALSLVASINGFGSRRNGIAHGRAFALGEAGFQLGPNNTSQSKWHNKGEAIGRARYRWNADDVVYYVEQFSMISTDCRDLTNNIFKERAG